MGKFRLFVDGSFVAEDQSIDLVAGTNVTLTVTDIEGDHTQPVVTISATGSGGAPTDADYLVGTANGSLSAEIVVGTSPGGELGGTWASPTVDATHAGSTHVTDHGALTGLTDDDHTQYRLESADHTHQTTGLQGGQLDHGAALTGLTDNDHTQYILHSIADAKGDLLAATAADTFARVAVGADGTVLTADSSAATGVSFAVVGAASHPSVISHMKWGVD